MEFIFGDLLSPLAQDVVASVAFGVTSSILFFKFGPQKPVLPLLQEKIDAIQGEDKLLKFQKLKGKLVLIQQGQMSKEELTDEEQDLIKEEIERLEIERSIVRKQKMNFVEQNMPKEEMEKLNEMLALDEDSQNMTEEEQLAKISRDRMFISALFFFCFIALVCVGLFFFFAYRAYRKDDKIINEVLSFFKKHSKIIKKEIVVPVMKNHIRPMGEFVQRNIGGLGIWLADAVIAGSDSGLKERLDKKREEQKAKAELEEKEWHERNGQVRPDTTKQKKPSFFDDDDQEEPDDADDKTMEGDL